MQRITSLKEVGKSPLCTFALKAWLKVCVSWIFSQSSLHQLCKARQPGCHHVNNKLLLLWLLLLLLKYRMAWYNMKTCKTTKLLSAYKWEAVFQHKQKTDIWEMQGSKRSIKINWGIWIPPCGWKPSLPKSHLVASWLFNCYIMPVKKQTSWNSWTSTFCNQVFFGGWGENPKINQAHR